MGLRSLSSALALALLAGSTCSLAYAGEDDHHDSAPQHAPAATPAAAPVKTASGKKSTTVSNTKVTAAHTSTKSAKQPAKPDDHASASTPTSGPTSGKSKSDAHADDHAGAQGDAPKTASPAAAASESAPDAAETLSLLTEGNARWVGNKPLAPHTDAAWREEVAAGQHPMVTILTCADSRIPVERVFDRGVGDVFVIRVAGNVAGGSETGTIEYGVEHLKTPLLVVMGHTKCGAVAAAATNAPVHGFVAKLVGNIQPAVDRARRANPDADEKTLSALAVNENVWQSVFDLFKASEPVRELVASGRLKVVGAVYDISSGKVDFLGEHPWQNELLASMTTTTSKPVASHAAGHTAAAHAESKPETKSESKPEPKPEAKSTAAASEHDDTHGNNSSGH